MLLLFRNNQFTTVIWLALYIGVLHIAAFSGTVHQGQMPEVQSGLLYDWVFGRAAGHSWLSPLLASVLVWIQAISINRLTDSFRLLQERNWLPGLLYALAASTLPDFLLLSPPLVAATFLPLSLRRLFQSYQQSNGAIYVFDAALWVSVAALFYPPALYLLLAVVASVLVMRSFSFREQWVFLIGAFVPFVLCWLGFFWADRGTEFLRCQFGSMLGLYPFQIVWTVANVLKLSALVLLLLLVVSNSGMLYHRKLMQTQKCITVLYWFMAVAGISAFLQHDLEPVHFLLLMPPVGIFLSIIFSSMRNRMIAEVAHLLLVGMALFIQYLPR